MTEFFDGVNKLYDQPSNKITYDAHPDEEILVNFLRHELPQVFDSIETITQRAEENDFGHMGSLEIGAHILSCEQCYLKAQDLRSSAQVQPWWSFAISFARNVLSQTMPEKLEKFEAQIQKLKSMPADLIKHWVWSGPTSPLGSWALGEEDDATDREGVSILSSVASLPIDFQTRLETETAISPEVKDALLASLKQKRVPKEFSRSIKALLE